MHDLEDAVFGTFRPARLHTHGCWTSPVRNEYEGNRFAFYGIGHLLEAALVWLVIVRYRSLIPLTYAFILCSQILAFNLLRVKPLPVVPPGQIGIYVLLPLIAVLFLLSIRKSAAR